MHCLHVSSVVLHPPCPRRCACEDHIGRSLASSRVSQARPTAASLHAACGALRSVMCCTAAVQMYSFLSSAVLHVMAADLLGLPTWGQLHCNSRERDTDRVRHLKQCAARTVGCAIHINLSYSLKQCNNPCARDWPTWGGM
jgi:hypothetical protein